MEKKWYTLRVYSGQESKVKAHLENEIKFKNFEEKFGRIIVPSEPVLEMREGKKRLTTRVFPSEPVLEMREGLFINLWSPSCMNMQSGKVSTCA